MSNNIVRLRPKWLYEETNIINRLQELVTVLNQYGSTDGAVPQDIIFEYFDMKQRLAETLNEKR